MKFKLYLILCICAITLSFVKQDEKFKLEDTAPLVDLKMKGTDSKDYSIKSASLKNGIIVMFSCNTCPFVVGNENFPGWQKDYNQLYDLAKEAEIGLILVNSNEAKRNGDDSFKAMKKHAKSNKYKMPYLVDSNSELANAFEAKTTPHVFILDSEFKLKYRGSIDNTWDSKRDKTINYLKNAIEELKNKQAITINLTEPRGCSIKRTK